MKKTLDDAKKQDAKDLEIFMEQFGDAIQLAANVYCAHREERDDTWNTMSREDLAGRLFEEFTEWVKEWNSGGDVKQCAEAVDVVNFALMFIENMGSTIMAVTRTRLLETLDVERSNRD